METDPKKHLVIQRELDEEEQTGGFAQEPE